MQIKIGSHEGVAMSGYKVLIGDCIESMRTLPDQSVNCCVTSPPYFGLRDYGQDGQIGLEATPDAFVAALVAVFSEVRRVLRDDGTVWLNLGDSYAANRGYQVEQTKGGPKHGEAQAVSGRGQKAADYGLKAKDLIGIPWRVAFALQADGWYLRQDIIWHKPNPMPESVRDRCTKAHEYIFMLSKSPKYYYDHEAVKEPSVQDASKIGRGGAKSTRGNQGYSNASGSQRDHSGGYGTGENRNRRSVWSVSTKPYAGAHFATFPPDLIEPCILAGCPEGGTVIDPFGGSGTTAGVSVANNRKAIICELNPEYAELIADRVNDISGKAERKRQSENQIDIFGEEVA
jgi:DNA modification methylase